MIYQEDIKRLLPLYSEPDKLRTCASAKCTRCRDFHGAVDDKKCAQATAQRD